MPRAAKNRVNNRMTVDDASDYGRVNAGSSEYRGPLIGTMLSEIRPSSIYPRR